jgi:hypothetical protein
MGTLLKSALNSSSVPDPARGGNAVRVWEWVDALQIEEFCTKCDHPDWQPTGVVPLRLNS